MSTLLSLSLITLIKPLPKWDLQRLNAIMSRLHIKCIELAPSMVLGYNWDTQICSAESIEYLNLLQKNYIITSIQSLTYGIDLNLGQPIRTRLGASRRFASLAKLGHLLGCNTFVLGSPGQKRLVLGCENSTKSKNSFIDNCEWMASVLDPSQTLCIEHNTIEQGAEFCNILSETIEVIDELRSRGINNVGLNLDTKCLLYEFGESLNIAELIRSYDLDKYTGSIQISLDFLPQSKESRSTDIYELIHLAIKSDCNISLEEFGLGEAELDKLVELSGYIRQAMLKVEKKQKK